MNVVRDTIKVEVPVSKDLLIEGRYVAYSIVSNKLKQMERDMPNSSLCQRLYNSKKCGKYNMLAVCGITCLDAEKPMATSVASLVLKFKFVEQEDENEQTD